jgi:hypothetical protein
LKGGSRRRGRVRRAACAAAARQHRGSGPRPERAPPLAGRTSSMTKRASRPRCCSAERMSRSAADCTSCSGVTYSSWGVGGGGMGAVGDKVWCRAGVDGLFFFGGGEMPLAALTARLTAAPRTLQVGDTLRSSFFTATASAAPCWLDRYVAGTPHVRPLPGGGLQSARTCGRGSRRGAGEHARVSGLGEGQLLGCASMQHCPAHSTQHRVQDSAPRGPPGPASATAGGTRRRSRRVTALPAAVGEGRGGGGSEGARQGFTFPHQAARDVVRAMLDNTTSPTHAPGSTGSCRRRWA